MKKQTALKALAVLAIGSTAALGVTLAGCGHSHEYSSGNDWGKDETGHWHYAICDDLKEGDADYKIDFAEHSYGDDNVCDDCGYVRVIVTLNVNGGTLADGTSTALTTVNGKLANLPVPATAPAERSFKGWYTEQTNGKLVTTDTKFTESTTIYAQWVEAGLFTVDGTFISELKESQPEAPDTAETQYGASGIELAPGDVFQIKIKGATLTHALHKLELWTSSDSHGVNLDQSAATFTVKAGLERPFDIYAKYYTNGTPCWSVYINDGLTDVLHEGEAYLVGAGWGNDGNWTVVADNYIDPVNGLTVTFTKDALFKVVDYTARDDADNHRVWNYNDSENYKMAEGKESGYLTLPGSSNGGVLAAGEYTIKIDKTGAKPVFIFTPAASVKPVELEEKYDVNGCYLVGTKFAGNDLYDVNENYYIDPDNGLTLNLPKGASLQVVGCKSATMGGADWIYKKPENFNVVGGKCYIDFKGGFKGLVMSGGEYKITVSGEGEARVFTFTPAASVTPEPIELYTSYLVGRNFVVNGTTYTDANGWVKVDALHLAPENSEGLIVEFKENTNFKIVAYIEEKLDYSKYGLTDCQIAEGTEGSITADGGNWTIAAGTYKITRVDKQDEGTIFYFELVETEPVA